MDQTPRARTTRETADTPSSYIHASSDRTTDERIKAIESIGSRPVGHDQFAVLNGFIHSTDFEVMFHVGSCTIRVKEIVPDRDNTGLVLTLESGGMLKRVTVPPNEILLISFTKVLNE